MMVKTDRWIKYFSEHYELINPFVDKLEHTGVLSYGLSSCGYDVRLAEEFKICTKYTNWRNNRHIIDPKNKESLEYLFADSKGEIGIIPANSFVLAKTVEYIKMPKNIMALVTCKSTYVRCGVFMAPTVLEPGWEGTITLEISNVTPYEAYIYANEGIAQIVFMQLDQLPETSYSDRGGKYMNQVDITLAKIKGR